MWTHERLKPEPWKGQRARYKQVKLNGHRLTAFRQLDGEVIAFEREVRPDLEFSLKHPWVKGTDWWQTLALLPTLTSVDGELHVPGGNAGDTAHAVAEGLPELEFMPFAVPWHAGESAAYSTLGWAKDLLAGVELPFAQYYQVYTYDDRERMLRDAADLGVEGWVLKNYNCAEWWKLKPVRDLDLVVTGFKDGRGKYLGGVGAIIGSAVIDGTMREVASVSGMTDDQRWDIDEERDLGRVFEVQYQYLGNGGRLVHPRFVRWRDDKPANECAYSEDKL